MKDTTPLRESLFGNGRCFWDVQPSGNWIDDLRVGEEMGRIWLEAVASGRPYPLLCWIVRDMIAANRYTGVECGFLQVIAGERTVVSIDLDGRPQRRTAW